MFSGIIETTGTITKIDTIAEGVRLRLQTNLLTQEISLGESICTNGACLTVTAIEADQLSLTFQRSRCDARPWENSKLAIA